MKYDRDYADSIIAYGKKLKDHTLRNLCEINEKNIDTKDKGKFGKFIEKYYFEYETNSNSEPDFPEAGLELKSSPLKTLQNGEFRSKERLVLNIINYLEVHKEDFETSTFWKKNAHLLLIFYLHEKDSDLLDYLIKLVDDWKYPNGDLKIIKQDWETINQKIKDGKAHELSEGDTFYLGACTKGSTAVKSYRKQPFNKERAKQRAYSLKQGYVNHIIAKISQAESEEYGKLIKCPEILDKVKSIEEYVILKFQPFYGKSAIQIERKLGLELNQRAKSYFANLTNKILGIELGQRIEEFEKAEIHVKTIRLKENDIPKENVSFSAFKYQEIIEKDWEDSDFKNILESKFFFVFYQIKANDLILKKVKFWNMPQSDISEAKKVWDNMVETISKGEIVKEISDRGIRKTYFPKKTENRISHVRPHARNKKDTYKLPVPDELTGMKEYTKHCFWLNDKYVKDEILNKK